MADEGFGTCNVADRLLAQYDFNVITRRSRLSLAEVFVAYSEYQKAAVRAGVLDCDLHQPLDEGRQRNLAGQSPRGIDDACQHIRAGNAGVESGRFCEQSD